MAYALAPGFDNVAGLIELSVIFDGEPLESYATSLGTFRASREFIGLDGIAQDDGDDTWTWTFAALTPESIEYLETEILDGARSGPVTATTRNRYGTFVNRNAILTLPQTLPLQGVKFGGVVFQFTRGTAVS
jgi:hypothetical protein